jgi:hypothetical protein
VQPVPASLAPAWLRLALVAALVAAIAASAALELAVQRAGGSPAPLPAVTSTALQQARCTTWLGAGAPERTALLHALAGSVGGPSTSGGVGTTLSDGEATRMLDRVCSSGVARGFLLYEIYIRAAGFKSVT